MYVCTLGMYVTPGVSVSVCMCPRGVSLLCNPGVSASVCMYPWSKC